MADEEQVEKTPLEKSRDIISQLKEMQHYSKTNIEKLTGFWLQVDDELKHKDIAKQLETLLTHENTVHDSLETIVTDYEAACAKLEPKS